MTNNIGVLMSLLLVEEEQMGVFGPDILQETEKQVHMVRENLWIALSRHKSYANHRRRKLSFEVAEDV
jgi:hypothetical protein